jgi:hypothetical protein
LPQTCFVMKARKNAYIIDVGRLRPNHIQRVVAYIA